MGSELELLADLQSQTRHPARSLNYLLIQAGETSTLGLVLAVYLSCLLLADRGAYW